MQIILNFEHLLMFNIFMFEFLSKWQENYLIRLFISLDQIDFLSYFIILECFSLATST